MYEVFYSKKAMKNLEIIKRDKKLYEDFKTIEKILQENPYRPNLPPSRIPKNGIKMQNAKIDTYHVKLTKDDRIFYRIDENDESIMIDDIEYVG